jgi:NADH:ubiquinone oxidoreductase subunit 5 (subunit L)/multisubunit Na+/H+ antiporter MnhA subunit
MVAFSTLRQLGFIFMTFYSLFLGLFIFHLLVHAFLKRILFILIGILILKNYSQSINKIIKFFNEHSLITAYFIICFNFRNFIYTFIYFSKEIRLIIIEFLFLKKFLFFICLILTLIYVKRFILIILRFNNYKIKTENV